MFMELGEDNEPQSSNPSSSQNKACIGNDILYVMLIIFHNPDTV